MPIIRIPSRTAWPALAVALSLAWASAVVAQDGSKPKDDALDSLLEKLDDKTSDESKAPKADPAEEKSTPADNKKADSGGKAAPKSESPDGPAGEGGKASGDVAPKDKDLDSLLEKLGETPDTPAPDDRPKGGEGPGEPPPTPGEPKPDELSGKSKDLDQHLEELTGRKPKKKDGDGDGDGKGPLSDIIKQMREIEERLGKPDTGEETRKKQAEVIKKFDTLIEQVRQSSSQSMSKKKSLSMKPGSQPGSKPGSENPGAMARGAPNTKPLKPNEKRSTAGGKDEWGHLPADLRQELENIFKEEALSSRSDLVRRYFLSLSKKSVGREN